MADPRIYTGAEALALREAATGGTWAAVKLLGGPAVTTSHNGYVIASVDDTGGSGATDAALIAAAPDLAASVAHHAERADKAEASDRQASETCADLRRQLLVVTAERDALRASRIRWIDAAGPAAHTLCPTCGVGVSVDEDGCCETCGSDAMGSYVDERRGSIELAEAADRVAGVPHE